MDISFINEPTGKAYEAILDFALKNCQSFSFAWTYCGFDSSLKINRDDFSTFEEFQDRMDQLRFEWDLTNIPKNKTYIKYKPYLIKEEWVQQWPGTQIGGGKALLSFYRITPESIALLKSHKGLYSFNTCPTDLCIYRSENDCWLGGPAHEEMVSFDTHFPESIITPLIEELRTYGVIESIEEPSSNSIIDISNMAQANKIYSPSYVSLETALYYYGLVRTPSNEITSVTSSPSRQLKNNGTVFIYESVPQEAFFGYVTIHHGGFDILIAEPEKALQDFMYFRTKNDDIDPAAVAGVFERLKFNHKKMEELDLKKMIVYGKIYGFEVGMG